MLPWHSSELDPVQLHFDYCTMAWLLSMNYSVTLPSCFCIVYRTLNTNVVLLCDPGSIPFNCKTSINIASVGAELSSCYLNSLNRPLIESSTLRRVSLIIVVLVSLKGEMSDSTEEIESYKIFRILTAVYFVFTGGHTTEILRLLSCLSESYSPRHYVFADSDKMSEAKIHSFEQKRAETFSNSQVTY